MFVAEVFDPIWTSSCVGAGLSAGSICVAVPTGRGGGLLIALKGGPFLDD